MTNHQGLLNVITSSQCLKEHNIFSAAKWKTMDTYLGQLCRDTSQYLTIQYNTLLLFTPHEMMDLQACQD